MREITPDRRAWETVIGGKTLHIFALGYEERCLAYPKLLSSAGLSAGHKFICALPPDENVSRYLRDIRQSHREQIRGALPPVHIGIWSEVKEDLDDASQWDSLSLDISSMPRSLIFSVLLKILKTPGCLEKTFVVYTFPAQYAFGPLQRPSPEIRILFDSPVFQNDRSAVALVIPGFDVEYTTVALAYINGACRVMPQVKWLLPFPGRRYSFYERAHETHIELMDDLLPELFPQEEIVAAAEKLKEVIGPSPDRPTFFIPLGPRLNCISVFLATMAARLEGLEVNVLYPQTLTHSSIRSSGCAVPLIEKLSPLPVRRGPS
jgi:hypothetical protein